MDTQLNSLDSQRQVRTDYNSEHFNRTARKIQKDLNQYYQRVQTEPAEAPRRSPVRGLNATHTQENDTDIFLTSAIPS